MLPYQIPYGYTEVFHNRMNHRLFNGDDRHTGIITGEFILSNVSLSRKMQIADREVSILA